eukprot:TRINITY_DN12205_c0_g2_i3.p1 TRINITY_DN12205_c0_g2~~TRINITY_DN12205_c0_g2_i3.p1  ORF type:complete len:260 (+),score=18.79 TRINITY_DN12205_c0_g2_i3:735-1514(+)
MSGARRLGLGGAALSGSLDRLRRSRRSTASTYGGSVSGGPGNRRVSWDRLRVGSDSFVESDEDESESAGGLGGSTASLGLEDGEDVDVSDIPDAMFLLEGRALHAVDDPASQRSATGIEQGSSMVRAPSHLSALMEEMAQNLGTDLSPAVSLAKHPLHAPLRPSLAARRLSRSAEELLPSVSGVSAGRRLSHALTADSLFSSAPLSRRSSVGVTPTTRLSRRQSAAGVPKEDSPPAPLPVVDHLKPPPARFPKVARLNA